MLHFDVNVVHTALNDSPQIFVHITNKNGTSVQKPRSELVQHSFVLHYIFEVVLNDNKVNLES